MIILNVNTVENNFNRILCEWESDKKGHFGWAVYKNWLSVWMNALNGYYLE